MPTASYIFEAWALQSYIPRIRWSLRYDVAVYGHVILRIAHWVRTCHTSSPLPIYRDCHYLGRRQTLMLGSLKDLAHASPPVVAAEECIQSSSRQ